MGTDNRNVIFILFVFFFLILAFSGDGYSQQSLCVNASVGTGPEGARPFAGGFNIPEGAMATGLTYRNVDPGGTYTKTTIDSAIFSHAQNRALFNPTTLPPGRYVVYASGKPGATARLCYNIVRTGRSYTGRSYTGRAYTARPPITQPPVYGNRSTLTKGWDIFNEPLSSGEVIWNVSGQNLQTTFQLNGAKPNHSFTVGVHLFNRSSLGSAPQYKQFGGYAVGGEGAVSRESRSAYVVAWDFGQLNTDRSGNGSARFNLPVPPGTYNVQFTVRIGGANTCITSRGITHGCGVVYRTGGRFAEQFETIVIRGDGRSYTARPPVAPPPSSQRCSYGPYQIKITLRREGSAIVPDTSGVFTVPNGCQAAITSYFWQDGTPGTGRSTQIGNYNIYSHTRQMYIPAPATPLPAGQYTFRIDGYPNASGHLQYNLAPVGGQQPVPYQPIAPPPPRLPQPDLSQGQPPPQQQPSAQQPPAAQPPASVDGTIDIFRKARDLFGR